MSTMHEDFYAYLAKTSTQPLGLEVVHAQGMYLYDREGRAIMDLIAGISVSVLGHGHPKVLEAIKTQATRYQHVMVYGECVLAPQVMLAKALVQRLPAPFSKVFFTNSGSEAVEGAAKLAKRYTGRPKCIAFVDSYHGSTQGALSLTGNEQWRRAYRPLLPGISHLKFGDEEVLDHIDAQVAAVIIEPVQGEAGVRIPSAKYLQKVSRRCREVGALLIFDEAQTGWGRTGTFWALEGFGIVPDVLVTAKALGGGLPLGAFIASSEVMECLTHDPVLGHISTFGGHPLSCAASLATLLALEKEGLLTFVEEKGAAFAKCLAHAAFSEIRRRGLLMALQLSSAEAAQAVLRAALEEGLLLDTFLFCDSALRIAPPLIINKEDMDKAAQKLHRAIKKVGI